MRRSWAGGWVAGAFFAPAAVAMAQQASPAADATQVVNAVWMEREIRFSYVGFTSYYSCDGLRDRVTWVLKELGARPGFKVTARGCARLNGPEMMPGVRIVAALPVAATPEVLARFAADASKRELAARAKGGSAVAAAAEATAQFPARIRTVTFTSSRFGNELQDGECELIEQLRDRVFGPLGVKVVEADIHCTPHQVNLAAVRMTVEVLEPLPPP